ncbi:hypothetical protein BMS3Abin08_01575 [bacterium BMS3Abin08]|nr:hypothetical protein BMS3Abin08_01575 [bacterium BMS3Abin08]
MPLRGNRWSGIFFMSKLGIIAGKGNLPLVLSEEARRRGYHVIMIVLKPVAEFDGSAADEVISVNVGRLGELIRVLKERGVKEAVMAGKVTKELAYRGNVIPDMKAIKLIFSLKDRRDDTILQAFTDVLCKEGIKILNTTEFAAGLLMPPGILTRRRPTGAEERDMEFGFRMAREIGRLDIGQTVVVKNRAVMAVEAIEGTDEAIRRGGRLAGEGAVVVKVCKPRQDLRFDVPVVGPDTLKAMVDARASVLAVESGKVIMLQRGNLVSAADGAGVAIVGFTEGGKTG